MNPCEPIREELKAYLDGQLPLSSRLRVRLHLGRCLACREEKAMLERLSQELREPEKETFDPALRARILKSLPDGPPEGVTSPLPLIDWRRSLRYSGALASGILLLVLLRPLWQSPAVERTMMKSAPEAVPSAAPALAPEATNRATSPALSPPSQQALKMTVPAEEKAAGASQADAAPPTDAQPAAFAAEMPQEVAVNVGELETSLRMVERLAREVGGYITTQQTTTGDDNLNFATVTVKVPTAQATSLVQRVTALENAVSSRSEPLSPPTLNRTQEEAPMTTLVINLHQRPPTR